MPFISGRDLKQDILFRAGEPVNHSEWGAKAIHYLNRVYRSLAMGASEFLPATVEDWWWLRGWDVLMLDPIFDTGTVTMTKDSTTVILSDSPDVSVAGWRLKVHGHPDLFKITSHSAGTTSASMDAPWPADTQENTFRLMRVEYTLDQKVAGLMSPMQGFRHNSIHIIGMTPERLDQLYPLGRLQAGAPVAFSMEGEQLVRFSHGGLKDGPKMRVEYRYRPTIQDITDSSNSIPLVPEPYRHILSDMALTYILVDKNDDRANGAAMTARSALTAMVRENKRRISKMDISAAMIFPRGGDKSRQSIGPLRTEAGLIIG